MVVKEHTLIRVIQQNVIDVIDRTMRHSGVCGDIIEHIANDTPYLSNNARHLMKLCKRICKHEITDFDVIMITNTIKELYDMYSRVDSIKVSLEQLMKDEFYINRSDFVDRLSKEKIFDILNDHLEIISECASNMYMKIQERNVSYKLI